MEEVTYQISGLPNFRVPVTITATIPANAGSIYVDKIDVPRSNINYNLPNSPNYSVIPESQFTRTVSPNMNQDLGPSQFLQPTVQRTPYNSPVSPTSLSPNSLSSNSMSSNSLSPESINSKLSSLSPTSLSPNSLSSNSRLSGLSSESSVISRITPPSILTSNSTMSRASSISLDRLSQDLTSNNGLSGAASRTLSGLVQPSVKSTPSINQIVSQSASPRLTSGSSMTTSNSFSSNGSLSGLSNMSGSMMNESKSSVSEIIKISVLDLDTYKFTEVNSMKGKLTPFAIYIDHMKQNKNYIGSLYVQNGMLYKKVEMPYPGITFNANDVSELQRVGTELSQKDMNNITKIYRIWENEMQGNLYKPSLTGKQAYAKEFGDEIISCLSNKSTNLEQPVMLSQAYSTPQDILRKLSSQKSTSPSFNSSLSRSSSQTTVSYAPSMTSSNRISLKSSESASLSPGVPGRTLSLSPDRQINPVTPDMIMENGGSLPSRNVSYSAQSGKLSPSQLLTRYTY